ncbi:hypothetical protein [Azospirillum argentinense]|uniref:Uncharacterized protein n=1 Tax=Azospirillum brasilense TaxID=192 RepID=A0A4D8QE57_AZOBR|nr:hypothetical protein [Azospirillum argentinense]QCO07521.1 hypothetical protein D3867_37185 [Azospirillum argentinense]
MAMRVQLDTTLQIGLGGAMIERPAVVDIEVVRWRCRRCDAPEGGLVRVHAVSVELAPGQPYRLSAPLLEALEDVPAVQGLLRDAVTE